MTSSLYALIQKRSIQLWTASLGHVRSTLGCRTHSLFCRAPGTICRSVPTPLQTPMAPRAARQPTRQRLAPAPMCTNAAVCRQNPARRGLHPRRRKRKVEGVSRRQDSGKACWKTINDSLFGIVFGRRSAKAAMEIWMARQYPYAGFRYGLNGNSPLRSTTPALQLAALGRIRTGRCGSSS